MPKNRFFIVSLASYYRRNAFLILSVLKIIDISNGFFLMIEKPVGKQRSNLEVARALQLHRYIILTLTRVLCTHCTVGKMIFFVAAAVVVCGSVVRFF